VTACPNLNEGVFGPPCLSILLPQISDPKLLPKPAVIVHSCLFSSTDFPITTCLYAPRPGFLPPSKCQSWLAGKEETAECEVDVAVLFLTLGCFHFCTHGQRHRPLLDSLLYEWHPGDSPLPASLHLSPQVRGSNVSTLRAADTRPSQ